MSIHCCKNCCTTIEWFWLWIDSISSWNMQVCNSWQIKNSAICVEKIQKRFQKFSIKNYSEFHFIKLSPDKNNKSYLIPLHMNSDKNSHMLHIYVNIGEFQILTNTDIFNVVTLSAVRFVKTNTKLSTMTNTSTWFKRRSRKTLYFPSIRFSLRSL